MLNIFYEPTGISSCNTTYDDLEKRFEIYRFSNTRDGKPNSSESH